jgi:hypothetical protein
MTACVPCTIERWTSDDKHIEEIIVRCSRIVVAHAALEGFRGCIITLSQGGRLIDGTAIRQRDADRRE